MIPFDPIWSGMVLNGPLWIVCQVWSHMSNMILYNVYGSAWARMMLHGSVRSCMVSYGPCMSFMVKYGTVWSLMVPLCQVYYCMVQYFTIGFQIRYGQVRSHMVPCLHLYDPLWYHLVPLSPVWSAGSSG